MLIKAMALPVLVVLLLFGSVFLLRTFRDGRLLVIVVAIALAGILVSGMAALVKLLILGIVVGAAILLFTAFKRAA